MNAREYRNATATRAASLYERLLERLAVAAIGRCQPGLATPEQWAKEISAMACSLTQESMYALREVERPRPMTPEEIDEMLKPLRQGATP